MRAVLEVLDIKERVHVQIDVTGEAQRGVQELKERLKAAVDKRFFFLRERTIYKTGNDLQS